MENLKIRVNNEAESKEAQELFFKLGLNWLGSGMQYVKNRIGFIFTAYCQNRYVITLSKDDFLRLPTHKEITLPELRAMVNPMKEYLDANRNYEFVLSIEKDDGFIEIPEGAEIAIRFKDDEEVIFYKNDGRLRFPETGKSWKNDSSWTMEQLLDENHSADGFDLSHDILWQREQDEPFLTPESTLNDQYAEKDNVNHPSHYTKGKVECLDALESATIGKSGIEAVCVANVIKYLWRYEEKNGLEDVKKAKFYLNRLLATLENNNG